MRLSQSLPDQPNTIRPIVVGNWKMNGLKASLAEALAVKEALAAVPVPADVMICGPATLTMIMAEVLKGSPLAVGAQNCHAAATGAHTGDISAEMVRDAGGTAVILGHSERRSAPSSERDSDVRAKVTAAHRAGLMAIV